MRLSLASFARSGLWSIVAHAVQLVGGLALSVVIVRALSPAEYGILSITRLITNFAAILSGLALERSVLRFIPEWIAERRPELARRLSAWGLVLRVVAWLPLLAVGSLYARSISAKLGGDFARELQIGLLTAVVFSIYNYLRALCAARFSTQAIAVSTVLNALVAMAATIGFLWAGLGVAGALWGSAAGVLVAGVQLAFVSWGRHDGPAAPRADSTAAGSHWGKRLLRYSAAFYGIAVLNHVVHSQIEIYFLGHFRGVEAAGYFQLGFLFAQRIVDFLPLALWEVSMAGFSHLVVREPARIPKALRDYLVLLYLILTPVAFLGFAFSGSAIRILYGDAMAPAIPISRAYFALAFVAAFNAPVGMIVYAKERMGEALRAYAFFASVNLLLDYVLIARWGSTGAVIALATAKLLNVALFARIAWREVPGLMVPWRFLLRVSVASSPVLLWVLMESRIQHPLWVAAAACAACMLLAVCYRLARVIGPPEYELLLRTRLPFSGLALRMLVRPALRSAEGS